jgi:hypothetical protein
MRIYEFAVDQDSRHFCDDVVEIMMSVFDITEEEALARVNKHWRGQNFARFDAPIYHSGPPEFWARRVYYVDSVSAADWERDPNKSFPAKRCDND